MAQRPWPADVHDVSDGYQGRGGSAADQQVRRHCGGGRTCRGPCCRGRPGGGRHGSASRECVFVFIHTHVQCLRTVLDCALQRLHASRRSCDRIFFPCSAWSTTRARLLPTIPNHGRATRARWPVRPAGWPAAPRVDRWDGGRPCGHPPSLTRSRRLPRGGRAAPRWGRHGVRLSSRRGTYRWRSGGW